MKKTLFLLIAAFISMLLQAETYHRLWDYTDGAPKSNPDRGLFFSSSVNDAEGVKNGLKGIKLWVVGRERG